MSRIAIFIDGAHLDAILKQRSDLARVDFDKLARELAGGVEILRTYYYHCPPYQSNPPTEEERDRFSRADKFFQALERLPRFEVRKGTLAKRYDENGNPFFEQKRVDLMIGVDLAILAGTRQITEAALLSGDSDLVPAVEAAKSQGVLVRLFHGQSYHKDLWEKADERTLITKELIDRVKRT